MPRRLADARARSPVARRIRTRAAALVASGVAALLTMPAALAHAQTAGLMRAMDLEQAGNARDAGAAYRAALRDDVATATLGLERVWAELGWGDSIRVVVDSVIRAAPRQPVPRTVLLRTLRGLGRDDEARVAFERWVREVPRDQAPYREWARILIDVGASAAADSVLQRAATALGPRGFAPEVARVRSAMGLWKPAAESWREALGEAPYLATAASYALRPAPLDAREAVVRALLAAPASLAARRAVSSLELGWGAPVAAWQRLADAPAVAQSAVVWLQFADEAENAEAWLPARDAVAAAAAVRRDATLLLRAAELSLRGGDAERAQPLADRAAASGDSLVRHAALSLRVRARAESGDAAGAARLADSASGLTVAARQSLARSVAWGWVRRGDIARARAALNAAGAPDDDEGAAGWLALYEGDLARARTGLARATEATATLVLARALLARTAAVASLPVGAGFLALARHDSARSAAQFELAAGELRDAAPLLLATSARLQKRGARAEALWTRITADWPRAPEAVEADLELARLLAARGATAQAITRLEHAITTNPESALVPQARRALERLRGSVPR